MGTAAKRSDKRQGFGGVPGAPSGKHRYYFGATLHTAGKRADARRRRGNNSHGPTLVLGQQGSRGR